MAEHIRWFVQKQCRCIINKQPNVKEKAPLHPMSAKYPFEMISIDFIELDQCSGGYKYGLVACEIGETVCLCDAVESRFAVMIMMNVEMIGGSYCKNKVFWGNVQLFWYQKCVFCLVLMTESKKHAEHKTGNGDARSC